jgi:transglutaminase-like putative cysteine protease
MNQSQTEGGIKFENNIRITSDGKKSQGFTIFFQTILILLGVIGIIYSWIEGLSLGVDQETFLLGIIITVLVHVGLNEIKRYQGLFFLLYFVIVGGFVYRYWGYIQNGFYCLENAIIEKAAVYYGLNPVRFIVELEPDKSLTAILLLVVQVIVLVTALEVYKHYMRSVYLFCILFFYGGLLAIGLTPPGSFMLLTLLAFLGFRTMDHIPGSYHKISFPKRDNYHEVAGSGKQIIRIKAALVIISCLLVSFLLVRVVITKDYYDQNIDLTDRKVKLQKAIKEFSVADVVDDIKDDWNEINPFTGDKNDFSGGLDSGKIGDVGEVKFTGETALNVTLASNVTYQYLKGFAGGRYESVEWVDLSKSEMKEYQEIVDRYGAGKYSGETLLWEWLTLEKTSSVMTSNTYNILYGSDIPIAQGDVKVDYVNANEEFMYAPYVSNYQSVGELNSIGDQYFAPKKEKDDYLFLDSYQPYDQNLSLADMTNLINLYTHNRELVDSPEYESFMQFEEAYRRFVYETYTQLPSQGLERLRSIQLSDEGYGIERTMEVVRSVISYLYENTNYSLSPGLPAKGVDFAEDFLFDKKVGYCSHYATAAVLLLRNYHIPARYIEGYVVTNQDIQEAIAVNGKKSVDVKDFNAHAWIEVYFDGVGWVPVEVTKGYSDNGVSSLIPEIEKAAENIESEKDPKVTPTVKPKPTSSPTDRPQVTKAPSISPTKAPGSGGITNGTTTNSTVAMWRSLGLLFIACIFVLFILFFAHYLIKRQIKLRHLTKGLPNEQGIYSYGQIEKLLLDQGILKSEAMSYEEFAQYAKETCSLLPLQFEEIVELALKAKFSKEGITKEEAAHICNYYTMFYTKVYQSKKKGKRFFMKYWQAY